jgi:hypothetical protein
MRRRRPIAAVFALAVSIGVGCASDPAPTASPSSVPDATTPRPTIPADPATTAAPETTAADPTTTRAATAPAGVAPEATVWLCRPDVEPNPCRIPLDTTVLTADGRATVVTEALPTTTLPVDCFFVYGTVSQQQADNADLSIDPPQIAVASGLASRFSSVCNVWAPVYRQRTQAALGNSDPRITEVAYASVHGAWLEFLEHHGDERPVVFLGHSQGTVMLIRLLQEAIDPNAELRGRMLSAVLLGGNVTVPTGQDVGATFQNIPACRAPSQTGCVIAYSTYPSQPPPDAQFGIPGQGISLRAGQTERDGVEVLCTNPAALGGGAAPLERYRWLVPGDPLRQQVTTEWAAFPDMYIGECKTGGGASWLDARDVADPSDTRPRLMAYEGPRRGFHLYDVNIAVGNLVRIVEQQSATIVVAR